MLQRLIGMRGVRASSALIALSFFCLRARSAQASSPEASAAQALFDEAKALMTQGNYRVACSKFEESQRLDPALGTLLNLADCREKEGRLASAWSLFRDAEGLAHRAGPADAEAVAHERARALEARLPRLLIAVAPGQPLALKVARNGIDVGSAQRETPIPLDPGEYRLTATAPGYTTFETTVTLKERTGTVRIVLPVLVRDPKLDSAPLPNEQPSTDSPNAHEDAPSHSVPTASWIVGGVGLAAIGTSAGFAAWASSQYHSVQCPDHVCQPNEYDIRSRARAKATAATVLFIGGTLAVGTSVLLWAAHPSPASLSVSRLSLRAGFGTLIVDGVL